MIEGLGDWIRGIAAAAVICGAALAITPGSKTKNVLKVLTGVVLIIALIEPIIDGDGVCLSMDMAQYRAQADIVSGDAEKSQTNLSRSIIEDQLNSYILDKAQTIGIVDLTAKVVMKWGDEGFWYPYEIQLQSNAGIGERNKLSAFIESELGIPISRQYWNGLEEEEVQNEN